MAQEPSTTPENEADVEQENVGRGNMQGQGEWPDPDTAPSGPAPGERGPTSGPALGSASQPDQLQTGESGAGTPGPARLAETDAADETPAQNFKEVLEADPVLGGSSSGGFIAEEDAAGKDSAGDD